jgi:hypothetical protein
MNLDIVLVIAAALALGAIVSLSVVRSLQTRESKVAVSVLPIDLEAFRNLINPAEDEYLRRRLPPARFRGVRRERLRAMAAYVHVAASNAALLARAGEAALAGGDVSVADAAQQLINDAMLVRRNTTIALARIYVALAWPSLDFAAVRVADRYERLSSAAMLLGRLQNPTTSVRLSAR